MTPALLDAIERFVIDNPRYSTQNGAMYQCDHVTRRFLEFAKDLGISDAGLTGYTFFVNRSHENPAPEYFPLVLGRNESGNIQADWHCIVETEDEFIDFTAKQYTDRAPYPLIIPKKGQGFEGLRYDLESL